MSTTSSTKLQNQSAAAIGSSPWKFMSPQMHFSVKAMDFTSVFHCSLCGPKRIQPPTAFFIDLVWILLIVILLLQETHQTRVFQQLHMYTAMRPDERAEKQEKEGPYRIYWNSSFAVLVLHSA